MLENLKWRRVFGNKCQIQVRKILSITKKKSSPSGRTLTLVSLRYRMQERGWLGCKAYNAPLS
jgi:hypothetical protein